MIVFSSIRITYKLNVIVYLLKTLIFVLLLLTYYIVQYYNFNVCTRVAKKLCYSYYTCLSYKGHIGSVGAPL